MSGSLSNVFGSVIALRHQWVVTRLANDTSQTLTISTCSTPHGIIGQYIYICVFAVLCSASNYLTPLTILQKYAYQ